MCWLRSAINVGENQRPDPWAPRSGRARRDVRLASVIGSNPIGTCSRTQPPGMLRGNHPETLMVGWNESTDRNVMQVPTQV
jgi:hypothetical protein